MPRADTIGRESWRLSRLGTDVDNYRRFYSLLEKHPNEEILVQFVAPKIIAFEEFRFYLLKNSVKKPLKPSNYYKPDYVSHEEYGTTNLWALLLFINDIPTIEDFAKEDILIPSKLSIAHITRDAVKRNLLEDIVPLHELPAKPTPSLFYKKKSVPQYNIEVPDIPFQPTDMYFNRENFIIDIVTARQRYVDLEYAPVAETVVLNVKNEPNFIYGKHYYIIRGRSGMNRLTWDSRKIPSGGIGLVGTIVEETEFEVLYARKV